MATRKRIKTILKWTTIGVVSSFLLFSLVLGMHIYDVTRPHAFSHTRHIEIGRIDFSDTVDVQSVQDIKSFIRKIEGVNHVYYNEADNILVYGFSSESTNAAEVFDKAKLGFDFDGELYQVTEEKLASSCPVVDQRSITGRLGRAFETLFTSIQ